MPERMAEQPTGSASTTGLAPGAWERPAEKVLDAYLASIEDASLRALREAQLRAVLRSEPFARGCPGLAMLALADLEGLRAHLLRTEPPETAAEVLEALRVFLTWAGEGREHLLPAEDVTRTLAMPPARDIKTT